MLCRGSEARCVSKEAPNDITRVLGFRVYSSFSRFREAR